MKATATNLLKFLQGTKQFIIPIYQRTYSWTLTDCQQLWDDIVRVAQDEQTPAHFVGSIVYMERGIYHVSSVTQLLVIDGQQRLTTLSLLLAALGEALVEMGRESNAEITRKKIYNYYLFNAEEDGDAHYKLLLTQSDKDTLIHVLAGGVEPSPLSPRIRENYLFFQNQIRQSSIDPIVLYKGISKLIVVDISLEQGYDNPQLIFESLNSTGVALSQADLIRNYVLMGLDSVEQRELYKSYWYPMEQRFRHTDDIDEFDRFMRDYLTLKQGSIPNIDKVYITFKAYHHSRMMTPIKDIVADIYRYANYFVNMAFGWEEDSEIKRVFKDINTLKVDVAYPFFLELYEDYAQKRLSKEELIAILKLIESYVFRRAICGILTNSLNKIFATLSKEIDKDHYLESVQAALLSKGAGGRFPREDEFRAAFVVKDVYNYSRRNYLLSKLEGHNRKEQVYVEGYTIEHIMPQNGRLSATWQDELGEDWQEVHTRYLHTIGNLTLTGYNSELSDRPFLEKRNMEGGFADSPLRLNRGLAKLDKWDRDEIEKRAAALADLAIQVWAIPQLSPEQMSKHSKSAQQTILAETIGPIDHPLAGFVPEGFKIVQISEKRFFLFRKMNNQWIQYGDGKKGWYAISWPNAGWWARDKHRKNEMPLGVGGEKLSSPTTVQAFASYTLSEDTNGNQNYTLGDHIYLRGNQLFEQLQKRILNLDVSVREEIKKMYVAYKTSTNFVDIEGQKKRLRISLNMPFSEIDDPKGLCRDITGVGHYGNGDVEISFTSLDQINDVMDLIRQSLEKHREED